MIFILVHSLFLETMKFTITIKIEAINIFVVKPVVTWVIVDIINDAITGAPTKKYFAARYCPNTKAMIVEIKPTINIVIGAKKPK